MSRTERALRKLANIAYRRPYPVLAIGVLAAVLGAWGMAGLRVDKDLKALLPADYPSVVRLERLKQRVGAQSDLIVVIRSPQRAANIAFGEALSRRLRTLDDLRYVLFKRDVGPLRRKALLYLPPADLLELRSKVVRRIRRETASKMVVDLDDDEQDSAKLDVDPDKVFSRYFGGAESPTEYMETDEGRLVVVKARPVRPSTDVAFATHLASQVQAIISELQPARFHPQLRAMIRGEFADRVGEAKSISAEVASSVVFALTLLLGLIAAFFRRLRAAPIVVLPIVVATLVTLGVGTALYGTFNIVTTFIFAILLGLGVDFSIHLLARYGHERRRQRSTQAALAISLGATGRPLMAGAVTTILVFALLTLATFRGFSQFGVVAAIGVVLSLVATMTLVPALVSVLERLRPTRRRPRRSRAARSPRATTRRTSTRVVAWGLVAASLALAVEGLLQVGQLRFEYDFGKLGPKRPGDPTDPGPDYRDAVGKTSTRGPAAALCDRERDCEQITRLLESVLLLDNEELQRLRPSFPDAPSDRCRGGTCVRQRTRASAAPEDDEDEDRLPPSDPFYKLQQALDGGRLLPQQRERLVALGWKRVNEMVTFLRGFLGLHVFLPAYQPLKLQIIADIRRRIDAKRWALSKDSRRQIGRWYHYLTVRQPITRDDLPPWLIRQLQQADGRVGRYLIVWNSGSKKDYAVAKRLYRAFFNLPTAGAKTVPLAANYFVLVEVMDTLKADAPVVVGACGAAVLVVLLLMFRSLRAALLVLSPLLFAGAWLLGLFVVLHWKLNLFSVVSLPLLIGMALDDGIHVYHRWQHERRVWTVLREVGGPITLTTLTTMIGFAGLLFADHVGVQTLGLTAATGMALALVAAAITLPALLYVLER